MVRTDRDGLQRQVIDHVGQPKNLAKGSPEFHLATAAARFCAVLAVPALLGGWVAAGNAGLAGAAVAIAVVVAQLYCSAAVLAICARRGGMTLMIGGYAGFVGRLALTTAVLAALAPVGAVHMPTLVISAIALMLAVLAYESWHVWRSPHIFWLEPPATPSSGSGTLERTRA